MDSVGDADNVITARRIQRWGVLLIKWNLLWCDVCGNTSEEESVPGRACGAVREWGLPE